MTLPTTLPAIVEALKNAGATEENDRCRGQSGWGGENSPPRQGDQMRDFSLNIWPNALPDGRRLHTGAAKCHRCDRREWQQIAIPLDQPDLPLTEPVGD